MSFNWAAVVSDRRPNLPHSSISAVLVRKYLNPRQAPHGGFHGVEGSIVGPGDKV